MQPSVDLLETEAKNFFATASHEELMETRAFESASLRAWAKVENDATWHQST
jgi:hypothetical protein